MNVGRPKTDKRKAECQEVALTCDECMRASARSLAFVAADLPSSQVRTLFHVMFPDANCRPMVNQFVQIVQSVAEPEYAEVAVIRKPPVFETVPLRVRVAVA